jgi:dihydrofolate reductase
MKLILACDPAGGIGYKNKLPWDKIQGDLPRFKRLTDGQVVVMGRNTYDSLPKKPLIGRLNFVVTSQTLTLPIGAIQVPNLNHFGEFKNAWLIGGAQLINSAWHLVDEIHLTRTFTKYTCDTFINLSKIELQFNCIKKEEFLDHSYEVWIRN